MLQIKLRVKLDNISSNIKLSKIRLSSNLKNLNQALQLLKKSVSGLEKSIIEKKGLLLTKKRGYIDGLTSMISSYDPSYNLKRGFSIIDPKIVKSLNQLKFSKIMKLIQ